MAKDKTTSDGDASVESSSDSQSNGMRVSSEYRKSMAGFLQKSLVLMNELIDPEVDHEVFEKANSDKLFREPFFSFRVYTQLLIKKSRLHVVAVLAANGKNNLHSLSVQMRPALECAGQVVLIIHNILMSLHPNPSKVVEYMTADYFRTKQSVTKRQIDKTSLPSQPKRFLVSDTVESLKNGKDWHDHLTKSFVHSKFDNLQGISYGGGVASCSTIYDQLAFAYFLDYFTHQILVMLAYGGLSPDTNLETDPFQAKASDFMAEVHGASEHYIQTLEPILESIMATMQNAPAD